MEAVDGTPSEEQVQTAVATVCRKLGGLFEGHDDLMREFETFLPPGSRIEGAPGAPQGPLGS